MDRYTVQRGSSPLTRGKRRRYDAGDRSSGLIPAHAWKTTPRNCPAWPGPAHPRSRGENVGSSPPVGSRSGSSPLTRGNLCLRRCDCKICGLIPAHAGKTRRKDKLMARTRAHPRSRGENGQRPPDLSATSGSSPLTRGKPTRATWQGTHPGLIPAHAGKTHLHYTLCMMYRAHPRSRGENPLTLYIVHDV